MNRHDSGRRRIVAVIECYFDDSYDDHNIPIVTMAGYVGTEDAWADFEVEIGPVYKKYGITEFHAKDFHSTKLQFKEWSRAKKHDFLEETVSVLAERVAFGTSFSALRRSHTERKADTGLSKTQSAYGFCFNATLDHILRDDAVRDEIDQHGATISIKIEDGNAWNDGLLKSYRRIKGQFQLQDRLSELSFVKKGDCKAIHMADAIAFFSRRHAQAMEGNGRVPVAMDSHLSIFLSKIPHVGIVATDFFADGAA